MPRAARIFPIFQAIGGVGPNSVALEYGFDIEGRFDLFGSGRLSDSQILRELAVSGVGTASTAAVPTGFVRYVVAGHVRTTAGLAPDLDLRIAKATTGWNVNIRDTILAAPLNHRYTITPNGRYILGENMRISLFASVATAVEIEYLYIEMPLGEYVVGP